MVNSPTKTLLVQPAMHVPTPNVTNAKTVHPGISALTVLLICSTSYRGQPASVFLSTSKQVLLVGIAVLPMRAATIAATMMEAMEPCLSIPCSLLACSAIQHSTTSFSGVFVRNVT